MNSNHAATIPDDDLARTLTIVDADHPAGGWISLAGNSYSMLITGEQTAGAYCLIEMRIPDGGGPPPHRHDFEELFTILEGEIEFTFRGETTTASAGQSVNIPANAPHRFQNRSGRPARVLCMCTPAGQDAFFTIAGIPIDGPDAAPPDVPQAELDERRRRSAALAGTYRTEFLT